MSWSSLPRRAVVALVVGLGVLAASVAQAASIQGITPGKSTRDEMQQRFGGAAIVGRRAERRGTQR